MSSRFIHHFKNKKRKSLKKHNDTTASSEQNTRSINTKPDTAIEKKTKNTAIEKKTKKTAIEKKRKNTAIEKKTKTKRNKSVQKTSKEKHKKAETIKEKEADNCKTTKSKKKSKQQKVQKEEHIKSSLKKLKAKEKLTCNKKDERKTKKKNKLQKKKIKDMASSCSGSGIDAYQNNSDVPYFSNHPIFRNSAQPKHAKGQKKPHKKSSTHLPMEEDGEGDATTVLELPGFYYDKEKKTYFKILPNNSCIGNAVTQASIKVKEKENRRKTDLSRPFQSCSKDDGSKLNSLYKNCLPCLSCHMQQGLISPTQMNHCVDRLRIKNIQTKPQTMLEVDNRERFECFEHVSQLEMVGNKRIVGLLTLKSTMAQKILWMDLSEKPRSSLRDKLSLSLDPFNSDGYYQSAVKISSMCPIDSESVLYTGMVYTGTPESLVFIKGIGEGTSRYEVYSIGQKATWTCAWNPHANQFSVGSEKCGLLLDVQTRRLWEINTYNSDVLCQVFSKQNGNYLYSGTRKNKVFTHDLRSISTYCVYNLNMSSHVCGLQLLNNDIHLLASDIKGKVSLWDLRTRKVVTEYHGLNNEYFKLPIHVDESEEVVYGVDQDGYTRLWYLQTGELLKTIPPPKASGYDFFPSILYSKNWIDVSGNAGLLMGLGNKIYVYSDYCDDAD